MHGPKDQNTRHNIARRVRFVIDNYRRSCALNYCVGVTFLYNLIPSWKFIVRLFPISKPLSKGLLVTIPSFVVWNRISETIFYFGYQTFDRYGRVFLYRVHDNRTNLVGIKIDMICRLHGWQTCVWTVNLPYFPLETALVIRSLLTPWATLFVVNTLTYIFIRFSLKNHKSKTIINMVLLYIWHCRLLCVETHADI